MSGSPPSYGSIVGNRPNNSLGRNWFNQFITLEFTNEEAGDYARLFAHHEIDLSMLDELNDGLLKSIGIEKAGHRIRILRLQNQSAPTQIVDAPAEFRCVFHPNLSACEKCYRCQRRICLRCRRQKNCHHGTKYYCSNCYEECVIL